MIVMCEECGKKYRIDVNRFKGPSLQYACRACNSINTVMRPQAADTSGSNRVSATPTRSVSAPTAGIGPETAGVRVTGVSLRLKITLIIVALVLISLSVVGVIATYHSRTALLNQAEQHLDRVANQKAREYQIIFRRLNDEVNGLAGFTRKAYAETGPLNDLGLEDYLLMPWNGEGYGGPEMDIRFADEKLVLQRVVHLLLGLVANNPYVTLGYFGSENNIIAFHDLKVVESISGLEAFMNTKRTWYTNAKSAGKTIWTEPYIDANTQSLTVTCATPVYTKGKRLLGVAALDVLLDTVQKDILSLDIGYQSYAFLVGNDGKALVRPGMDKKDARWDDTYQTEDLLNTPNTGFNKIIARMVKGEQGVRSYAVEGEEKYLAYASLPVIGASMGIVASKAEVIKPAVTVQNLIIGVWVGVLLLSVITGLVLGSSIVKPINQLTSMADLISQGKIDLEVIPEERKDEIGVLTKAFNRLVVSLKVAMSR